MDPTTLDAVKAIMLEQIAKTKWANDARILRVAMNKIETLRPH